MLNAFTGVNKIQKFLDMELPLACYTNQKETQSKDFSKVDVESKESHMFEIDLSNIKKISKKLKIASNKVDCYPLAWFRLETKKSTEWKVKIK
jgi:hypothetical protein